MERSLRFRQNRPSRGLKQLNSFAFFKSQSSNPNFLKIVTKTKNLLTKNLVVFEEVTLKCVTKITKVRNRKLEPNLIRITLFCEFSRS